MKFKVVTGGTEDQIFTATKNEISVGRSNKCDLIILDSNISRDHLYIKFIAGQTYACDMGSANGSYINNIKLEQGRPTLWPIFFTLQLGAITFITQIEDGTSTYNLPSKLVEPPKKTDPKNQRPIVKTPPKKSLSKSFKTYFPILLFILLAFYLSKEESTTKNETRSDSILNSQLMEKKCSQGLEQTVCSLFDFAVSSLDGIQIHGKTINLFLDFESYILRRGPQDPIAKFRSKEQEDLLMHVLILKLCKNRSIDKLLFDEINVVNYNDATKKIKKAFSLDLTRLKAFSPNDINVIFSSLNQQDRKVFDALILPLTKPIII
jgi:pSer/pThr/pTyr-binding forkhead associated (FHA) protein